MTGFQKFIKYAAIAFGIYLSITISFYNNCISIVRNCKWFGERF